MDPIRSRTPSPARELQAGSQPDGVQPTADRRVSPPAGSPLDGLPARRTMSRTQLPPPPASVPAFSAGSFSDLLRQVDSSLFDASFFDSMPAFGAHHAQAATGELDEVQSALRAADDPQPPVRVAVTAARPPRAKPAQRPRRAAQTSDASPAADVDLSTFGYSQQQQEKIKPTVRSTVAQHHAALVGHGFTHAHIVELSKHPAALGTIAARYSEMIAALPEATHEDIVGVGKQWSGARALEALLMVAEELRAPPLQLVTGQLLKIAKRGGVTAVEAVHASRNALTGAPLHLTPEQVVAIVSNNGGKPALETVQRLLPVLCQPPYGLTPEQVVAIASHDGAKQALETVQRLLPVLCQPPYGLTPEQVVAIASNGGGKPALETVQRLLPVLCQPPYGLTPGQVVAIASNIGGKQALETVQRLLPVLCQDHGLTPNQVVAIASHDGGKPALETVQRLLPVLCQPPYGLTPDQVVAIASHDGAKQALETVQRLLPVLCKPPHPLTPNQVVAIASHDGAKQALESIFAQLSSPDPALAALTNDRLVALACIGGRPALDAVKKGLPHAPELITRVHNRVPEGTAHLVADHAQVVRVLSFFQCHSHPAQAFDEAMRQFGMSRHGLLQLFHRVGVTELEARSGTLPPASQRWDRMLQASGRKGAKPPSASAQTQGQESLDAFADSLERELDAPSPMHQAGQTLASSRKRSRSASSVNRSSAQQAAEVFVPEQRDAPPLLPLSSWGVKRRRTRIGGLPDPGTPTHGDLAASSAAFLEQDADPFAGAAEDFPAFDQEEIAWLKELLAH
ncbi:TAL effector repeat-containing protein [Xanthomonas translucens pv. translucens]|uniref:avirulence protein n=1 Tax=Xanthomonas campestris pv. translucens TaxID=343 RepID=UPI0012978CD3|nr:avirulence protein [Xanthomonas translucens]MQS40392.1 avirulence protein [Xanthomonas translucens pv. translucens]QSQ32046.1 TAL effector repeat-containing protein [Xanthomonas translucens pv. translucens]QSQ45272.1 TAL effector repeat-containing protein [Xanthomonas translucens pv. translucens]